MASDSEVAPGLTKQAFLDYAAQNQAGLTAMFVGVAVFVYDYLLTFEYEVRTVWATKSRFSFAKSLFLLNRYITFVHLGLRMGVEITDNVLRRATLGEIAPRCSRYLGRQVLNWVVVGNWLGIEGMLIMCIWALWNRTRWVGISLSALTVMALCAALALQNVRPASVAVLEPEWLFPCLAFSPVTRFWLYTLGSLVQVASFVLFLMKISTLQVADDANSGSGPRIGSTLFQHCVIYYGCVLVLMGLGLVSTIVQRLYIPVYTSQVLLPLMATICSRLGLALRDVLQRRPAGLTGITYQTNLTIDPSNVLPSHHRRDSWSRTRKHQRQQLDTLGMARLDSPDHDEDDREDHELDNMTTTTRKESPKTSTTDLVPNSGDRQRAPLPP